jgi:thiamine monophosphate synthase
MLDALEHALERGLKLLQLREPGLGDEERRISATPRSAARIATAAGSW